MAEAWAAEMFQSGTHAPDEWAYIAALHTDRAHPHVHIVVNNRGVANDTWFYMAKGHAFEIQAMKDRMVEIAAAEGLFLDSSSRIDRGKLTYGPSRAELEVALREGRPVREKPLEGRAIREAMIQIWGEYRHAAAVLLAGPAGRGRGPGGADRERRPDSGAGRHPQSTQGDDIGRQRSQNPGRVGGL